jgi:hypothetical protein
MADDPEAPHALQAPEAEAVGLMSRVFLAVSGLACLVGTGLVFLLIPGHAQAPYTAIAFGALAVVALASTLLRGRALRVAVTLVFSSLVLLIGLNSVVQGWGLPPVMVVAAIMLFYVVLGSVMDELSMILLTIPIFSPWSWAWTSACPRKAWPSGSASWC